MTIRPQAAEYELLPELEAALGLDGDRLGRNGGPRRASSSPTRSSRDSRSEWTEEELQYSISASPSSPGDDRFRIPARSKRPSSLQFPFNAVCLLERRFAQPSTAPDEVSGCLIAPQVVLTAGHCVHSTKGTIVAIDVSPGADLCAASSAQRRPASPATISAARSRFRGHSTLDYAVIVLPRPFARPARFMRLQPRSDVNTATILTIAGYPCDKARGTMWGHSERVQITGVTPTHLRYSIDTCPGHSGSPIWLLGNDGVRIQLGVHTSGISGCDNDPAASNCIRAATCGAAPAAVAPVAGTNCGIRITCDVIRQIVAWCAEFGVQPPAVDARALASSCGGPPDAIAPPSSATRLVLRRGFRGRSVIELQTHLDRWIATRVALPAIAPLAVDGLFGPGTDAAVRTFQREHALPVDGIVGVRTWGALLCR